MLRLLLLAGFAFLVWNYKSFVGGSMDGTVWEVHVKGDHFFSLAHPETLVFESGHFISAQRLGEGFFPASYQAEHAGYTDTWQASLANPSGESLQWSGKTSGDRILGTVTWTRKDGKIRVYSFHGTRKS